MDVVNVLNTRSRHPMTIKGPKGSHMRTYLCLALQIIDGGPIVRVHDVKKEAFRNGTEATRDGPARSSDCQQALVFVETLYGYEDPAGRCFQQCSYV